jgi:antitoxin MazE
MTLSTLLVSPTYLLCVYYVYLGETIVPESQIVKWGNSLAVRIPKPLAEEAGVREGDAIVIEAAEGLINLRPKLRVPTLAELVAQITRDRRYEEIQTGPERGKEEVEW